MYLGHHISEKGIETDSHKMQVIWNWPGLRLSLRSGAF